MEDEGVPRRGVFVWEIDNFWEKIKEDKRSPAFKFGKYDCYLKIPAQDDREDVECCMLSLNESKYRYVNYNTFFNINLINGHGEQIVSTKGIALKFDTYFFQLMKIWYSDLRCEDNYLLPDGVLKLRMSWCDEKNSTCEQDTQAASNLNPEKEQSKLLQKLSQDFGRFYENKKDADFLLRVGEDLIPVHSSVLSARSKVFAKMFCPDISEDRNNVIKIPDVDAVVFRDVLYYIYSGKTRGLSADTMFSMHCMSNKFHLIELKDACLDFIMQKLTVENVPDAAPLAYGYKYTKHWNKVIQFVRENREEIWKTDKGNKFLKSRSYFPDSSSEDDHAVKRIKTGLDSDSDSE